MKNTTVDVTGGPLTRSILQYAFPVMLASLIQVLFNAADLMVLGNMAPETAVAAVGVTGPIVSLAVTAFVGLSGGTNVVLARCIGAQNRERAHACIDTSLFTALAIGVVIAIVGWLLAPRMLGWVDCPATCMEAATVYLRLYFLGAPAIMLYNFASAIVRVSGNSTMPLVFMIASGVLNVILNVVLCLLLTQKVAAVAIATLASQVLGAALTLLYLLRIDGICRVDLRHMCFSPRMLGRILYIGLPCGLSTAMYSLSNLQIQSAINAYGASAIAGNSAGASVEGLVSAFVGAFGVATLAFVGQNIGAGNAQRVRSAIRHCVLLGGTIGLVLGLSLFAAGHFILSLYLPGNEAAIAYGLVRMRYVLAFYFIIGIRSPLENAIQAFGHSLSVSINSILTVLVFRIFWMSVIYPKYHTIQNLYFCYTVSWTLGLLATAVIFCIVFALYRRGVRKTEQEKNREPDPETARPV